MNVHVYRIKDELDLDLVELSIRKVSHNYVYKKLISPRWQNYFWVPASYFPHQNPMVTFSEWMNEEVSEPYWIRVLLYEQRVWIEFTI